MWKRKRKLEAEAVKAVNFLWKWKRFDERGWKRKQFFQNQALPDFQTGYIRWGKI